jgi:hypothetical protein
MDAPIYERFDTNQGFQAAVDRLLEQPAASCASTDARR